MNVKILNSKIPLCFLRTVNRLEESKDPNVISTGTVPQGSECGKEPFSILVSKFQPLNKLKIIKPRGGIMQVKENTTRKQ